MILIFDLFETLIEDLTLDFNLGLKPFWEEHYKDKCSFDEIKAYGEELYVHMQDLHKQGFEFPFVKDELPMYVLSNSGFSAGALQIMLNNHGICNYRRAFVLANG